MLAIARALAVLCAWIGHVLGRCSVTLEILSASEAGSIATLICDAGERYDGTLFAPGGVAAPRFGAAAAVQDSDDRPAP